MGSKINRCVFPTRDLIVSTWRGAASGTNRFLSGCKTLTNHFLWLRPVVFRQEIPLGRHAFHLAGRNRRLHGCFLSGKLFG